MKIQKICSIRRKPKKSGWNSILSENLIVQMSRSSGTDVGNLIRGNHSIYLLGREAINELQIENQQLNYENNKLRTDLDLKNIQISSLKRKLWEKQNELSQVAAERDWFQKKTQNLVEFSKWHNFSQKIVIFKIKK